MILVLSIYLFFVSLYFIVLRFTLIDKACCVYAVLLFFSILALFNVNCYIVGWCCRHRHSVASAIYSKQKHFKWRIIILAMSSFFTFSLFWLCVILPFMSYECNYYIIFLFLISVFSAFYCLQPRGFDIIKFRQNYVIKMLLFCHVPF